MGGSKDNGIIPRQGGLGRDSLKFERHQKRLKEHQLTVGNDNAHRRIIECLIHHGRRKVDRQEDTLGSGRCNPGPWVWSLY